VASSARFGVGGAKSAARHHGEVFLRTRRRGQEGAGVARSAARRHGKVFLRARRSGQEGGAWRSFHRCESACARARSAAKSAARRRAKLSSAARRGLQPGDVRSSLRSAPAGEGAEAHDLQPGEVFGVSAWAKARWPAGPQPGVVAMCSSARADVCSIGSTALWDCAKVLLIVRAKDQRDQ